MPVTATLYLYPDQDADIVRQRASLALNAHFAFEQQTFGHAVYTAVNAVGDDPAAAASRCPSEWYWNRPN